MKNEISLLGTMTIDTLQHVSSFLNLERKEINKIAKDKSNNTDLLINKILQNDFKTCVRRGNNVQFMKNSVKLSLKMGCV